MVVPYNLHHPYKDDNATINKDEARKNPEQSTERQPQENYLKSRPCVRPNTGSTNHTEGGCCTSLREVGLVNPPTDFPGEAHLRNGSEEKHRQKLTGNTYEMFDPTDTRESDWVQEACVTAWKRLKNRRTAGIVSFATYKHTKHLSRRVSRNKSCSSWGKLVRSDKKRRDAG